MERFTERELCDGKVVFSKCQENKCSDKCAYCEVPEEAMRKLKKYEDMEENGSFLYLPCDIGTVVYGVYEGAWEYKIDDHKITLEDISSIGETVFLTKEEAMLKIRELNDNIG